ncbi:MAG TPA: hypothetical protein QGH28_03940 [Chloroflexota bacterium]|nr:hypothetical protein [Chloroflexota bacterium]
MQRPRSKISSRSRCGRTIRDAASRLIVEVKVSRVIPIRSAIY